MQTCSNQVLPVLAAGVHCKFPMQGGGDRRWADVEDFYFTMYQVHESISMGYQCSHAAKWKPFLCKLLFKTWLGAPEAMLFCV